MNRRIAETAPATRRAIRIRRMLWIGVVVAAVVVGAAFVRTGLKVYRLGEQKAAAVTELARLRAENHQLVAQRDQLQTDAAAERLAREELGWTRPGETLVVVVTATPAPRPPPTAPPSLGSWWRRVFR